MWQTVLDKMLRKLIVLGQLRVEWPDGTQTSYGSGTEPVAHVTLTDESILRDLSQKPVLALGEGYMDGRLQVPPPELYDLIVLLIRNQNAGQMPAWFNAVQAVRGWTRSIEQRNTPASARRNVHHHYDISDDLYRLFLDRDMQYSCAYFARPDMTLDEAQQAKKEHIAHKLLLRPGMRVLDIGCGWGGLALTLARDHGAQVVGVTLSENQLATARRRAEAEGLSDQVDFRLLDYRKVDESFDRIVSVGMLEHVGYPHLDEYFAKVDELLSPEGIALIHTIGHVSQAHPTSTWIDKYIFPGGYIPSLSEVATSVESTGLWAADVEILRGHYGPTLRHWRTRFENALPRVREMYDERFVRMWRFYLSVCEAAFEETFQGVFHLQLSHRQRDVPVTRDYLHGPGSSGDMMHAAQ